MTDNHGIIGFHHLAIRAKDFEQTLHFYTEGLGFTLSHAWSLPAFNLRKAAMLKSPDGKAYLELYDQDADIPAQGRKIETGESYVQTALLHLCLTVKDATIAYEHAISVGARPCLAPMSLELGSSEFKVKNSLVYSPNGEVIEFLEPGNCF